MVQLMNFAINNPTLLGEADFLASFVARGDVLARILRQLGEIDATNLAAHRLIVGQRGMGKTSLLRRVAIAVEHDAALSAVLLPLTFREEQYNIHNLHIFWCNCLDALGDYFERHGQQDAMRALDRDVASISRSVPKNDDEQQAYRCFIDWAKRLQRRPLLLLDNMDFIFDVLGDDQAWILRRYLQAPGGVVVLGAATRFLESAGEPTAAFYEFFKVDVLPSLDHAATLECLRELARRRGAAGQKVLSLLASDPARIRALRDLSGGNPRTVVLLYLVLETNADGDAMSDLESLLDQVSPLYKGRIEDLAPQARVVLDAVALAWNPIVASEIAAASGVAAASVTPQLDRLVKLGLLEKCALARSSATGYQLGERFFNIWYLMRNASRRARHRLRWLVEFLRNFYTPQERCDLARSAMQHLCGDPQAAGQYALVLRESLEDDALRHALGHHATRLYETAAAQTRTELAKIVDLSDLHEATHTMTELREQVLHCKRDWYGIDPAEFWEGLGGSLLMSIVEKQRMVEILPELQQQQLEQLLHIFFNENNELNNAFLGNIGTLDVVRRALREGILEDISNVKQAVSCVEYFDCPGVLAVVIRIALDRLAPTVEDARDWIALLKKYNCPKPLGAMCWNSLGNLLRDHPDCYEEAELAYRQAIALDENLVYPWINLGDLLQIHLGRYEEAEQAYRQAIALDEINSHSWHNLGNLLQVHMGRYEEAEQAYRQAIALDEKSAKSLDGLGNLLQDHLSRHEEAEQAYRHALQCDQDGFFPMSNLAYLFFSQATCIAEAEHFYTQALQRMPPHGAALLRAYREFAYDNFGAATQVLREALDSQHVELLTTYLDDLLRNLRLAASKGYGEKLLAFFDESGLSDRYWPIRAAFEAYLYGEERLLDVNPEVRSAARRIYAWLDSHRRASSGAMVAAKPSKTRARRKATA